LANGFFCIKVKLMRLTSTQSHGRISEKIIGNIEKQIYGNLKYPTDSDDYFRMTENQNRQFCRSQLHFLPIDGLSAINPTSFRFLKHQSNHQKNTIFIIHTNSY
jgi:hypothetical protein